MRERGASKTYFFLSFPFLSVRLRRSFAPGHGNRFRNPSDSDVLPPARGNLPLPAAFRKLEYACQPDFKASDQLRRRYVLYETGCARRASSLVYEPTVTCEIGGSGGVGRNRLSRLRRNTDEVGEREGRGRLGIRRGDAETRRKTRRGKEDKARRGCGWGFDAGVPLARRRGEGHGEEKERIRRGGGGAGDSTRGYPLGAETRRRARRRKERIRAREGAENASRDRDRGLAGAAPLDNRGLGPYI